MKKILIDARMYGLENSGIGRYLVNLINELDKSESDINYLILLKKKYFNELNLSSRFKKILADFGHYGFSEQIKLPLIINSLKPDLVHFPHLNVPIFWKGKFVVTVHDLTMQRQKTDATTLPLPVYYFKRLPFLFTSRFAVKNSLKTIAPTKFVANDLVDYYKINKDKIKVIYEGIDSNSKTSKYGDNTVLKKYAIDKPYFLYVGNAYPHKNIKRAIEAIKYLNKRSKDKVWLVLGGSRSVFTERVKKEVEKLQAESFIKQIGYVEDVDLPIINRNSVGFLYPSFSEGFGLQGLEAMAAGTILVCSNIPVFREIYDKHAVYFNPFDFSSVAASMKLVMDLDKEKREKMVKKSQKFIQKYSWSEMARETIRVYESCTGI